MGENRELIGRVHGIVHQYRGNLETRQQEMWCILHEGSQSEFFEVLVNLLTKGLTGVCVW